MVFLSEAAVEHALPEVSGNATLQQWALFK